MSCEKEQKQYQIGATSLKEIKVAGIMDPFTMEGFQPECRLMELTTNGWSKEIEEWKPDLLFLESAWLGKDGLWSRKISNMSSEVYQLMQYCRSRDIPIVFWNKEDPVYTSTFLPIAKLADFVFTTDVDCISVYQKELKHNRIYHLHFAAQPAIYHPVGVHKRKDRCCFAGAYYQKYEQRKKCLTRLWII